jgi:WD40 repeat protein
MPILPDIPIQPSEIVALAATGNGKRFAFADENGNLTVYDGNQFQTAKNAGGKLLGFNRDGSLLVSQHYGDVFVWNPVDLSNPKWKFPRKEWYPYDMKLSPSGRILAMSGSIGGDKTKAVGVVRLFDLDAGKELAEVPNFPGEDQVYGLAFHPTSSELAVGNLRGRMTLWTIPGAK